MKSELFKKISFHDAEIKGYKKDGESIVILIKDGWIPNVYYKVKLKNVKIEIMDNEPKIISYTLNELNNKLLNNDGSWIDSADFGTYENNKYYLKLYMIGWPSKEKIEKQNIMNEYYFDGFNVRLCNDYNDTGIIYVKFIIDDFDIQEI